MKIKDIPDTVEGVFKFQEVCRITSTFVYIGIVTHIFGCYIRNTAEKM